MCVFCLHLITHLSKWHFLVMALPFDTYRVDFTREKSENGSLHRECCGDFLNSCNLMPLFSLKHITLTKNSFKTLIGNHVLNRIPKLIAWPKLHTFFPSISMHIEYQDATHLLRNWFSASVAIFISKFMHRMTMDGFQTCFTCRSDRELPKGRNFL